MEFVVVLPVIFLLLLVAILQYKNIPCIFLYKKESFQTIEVL
ncbi:hypothetical protein EII25_01220 [Erysipelotrichaceae bacterium OH741_COT-311]|nr:hypothetical protein EII25_01220 [Erysipelotrichaceae bacterium OH741_COT-311]